MKKMQKKNKKCSGKQKMLLISRKLNMYNIVVYESRAFTVVQ